MSDQWESPSKVTDVQVVFGGGPIPMQAEIPKDYPQRNRWLKFQSDGFLIGEVERAYVREGIDPKDVHRHLKAIQTTDNISHEHKQEAVAWLASQWLEFDEDES